MAKVRKFSTDVPKPTEARQGTTQQVRNAVPDLSSEVVETVTATAPVQIRNQASVIEPAKPGNPRKRRYKQKTYSLLQEDIDLIEDLVTEIRQGGLYERGRSDIVRAGVNLLKTLPIDEKLEAVQAVEKLSKS